MDAIRYAPIETPLGAGWFAYTPKGVAALAVGRNERAFLAYAERALGARPVRSDPPSPFARKVREAMHRGDGTAADLSFLGDFQRKVLQATSRIPAGAVRPYAWVARAIGAPKAVRAVGTALARNPVPFVVPCHRVVRSDGRAGNYGIGGERTKRALLRSEGARL